MLAITADGASINRLLFTLLSTVTKEPTDDIPYKVLNPYTDEKRSIYFISDPPHLLKTIRNCVANKRRNLWVKLHYNTSYQWLANNSHQQNKGKVISWDHIEDLYKLDSGACGSATAGLCLVPKLKYEHIHLTSFSKMRVDLAAQV